MVLTLGTTAHAGACAEFLAGTKAQVSRISQYIAKDYWPEVRRTRGARIFLRDYTISDVLGGPEFLRPIKPWDDLNLAQKVLRQLNPSKHVSRVALGRPRQRKFVPVRASVGYGFRVAGHYFDELTKLFSRAFLGRNLRLTIPVVMGLTISPLAQPANDFIFSGGRFIGHTLRTQVDAYQMRTNTPGYLKLLENDYRYHDIDDRLRGHAITQPVALTQVQTRQMIYDGYFSGGLRNDHFKEKMSGDDLRALVLYPLFSPYGRFVVEGIPEIPGYQLKAGAPRGPINRSQLESLIVIVDETLVRQQVVEHWVDNPEFYRELKASDSYGPLTVELEQDPFVQDLRARFDRGELTAGQLKWAAQKNVADQGDFAKCVVLGLERLGPGTGAALDLKALQTQTLQNVLLRH